MDKEVLGIPFLISHNHFQGLKEEVLSTLKEQDEYIWEVPSEDKRVCFSKDERGGNCLWMYNTLVTHPGVRLSFSEFQFSTF